MEMNPLRTSSSFSIGRDPAVAPVMLGKQAGFTLICGPCVIESRDHILRHAERILEIAAKRKIPLIFKSSYDKANRTAVGNFRGLGIEAGLEILAEVRQQLRIPVITDVHGVEEVNLAGQVVDCLQIPAFLCRQTDLLLTAGKEKIPVLIKKGQFLAPDDVAFAVEKVNQGGGVQVAVCERGACFGYRDLVVDFRSLDIMSKLGCPVVFDATHSVQVMGGSSGSSGGNREYALLLARAAVAVGVDGIFLECHESPDTAPSDAKTMLPLERLAPLLDDLVLLQQLPLQTRRRVA